MLPNIMRTPASVACRIPCPLCRRQGLCVARLGPTQTVLKLPRWSLGASGAGHPVAKLTYHPVTRA